MNMVDRKVTIMYRTRMSTTVHPFIWSIQLLLWAVNGFLDQILMKDVSYWRGCNILSFYAGKVQLSELTWPLLCFFLSSTPIFRCLCLQALIKNVPNIAKLCSVFLQKSFLTERLKISCVHQVDSSILFCSSKCFSYKLPAMEQMIPLLQIYF